ncbi:MAG TPA: hypothetical protein VF721_03435 [Pyrinomonadaceae bacterium]|jgi:hypothetical protein
MVKRYVFSLSVLLLLCFDTSAAEKRRLLYSSESVSPKLREIVKLIRNPKSDKINYDRLSHTTGFFVRLARRVKILTPKNKLLDTCNQNKTDAFLGGQPFVFLTRPESFYGRSLLEIYADIGYEAEDIIKWQLNEEMVAIVFRYPDNVSPAQGLTDGNLPREWDNKIYIPSWENMFSLFHRLSENAGIYSDKNETSVERIFFSSETEKAFVLNYPAEAKRRIKNLFYYEIKARGGDDWRYRKLLEEKLSAFEHFRGDGRTQNEILDREGKEPRFPEFVGPNKKVRDLPEVAIIHLGKLIIKDTYVKDR